MGYREALGAIAGILSILPCPVYVRAILSGRTKPDRATWWVLAAASLMIAASNWEIGARDTAWLPGAYSISFLAIALLSLQFGEGPARFRATDKLCLGGFLIAAVAWRVSDAPRFGLVFAIIAEFVGLVPTIAKAALRPWTEDRAAWRIATVASVVNLAALTNISDARAIYPLYVFVTNALITLLLVRPYAAASVAGDIP